MSETTQEDRIRGLEAFERLAPWINDYWSSAELAQDLRSVRRALSRTRALERVDKLARGWRSIGNATSTAQEGSPELARREAFRQCADELDRALAGQGET